MIDFATGQGWTRTFEFKVGIDSIGVWYTSSKWHFNRHDAVTMFENQRLCISVCVTVAADGCSDVMRNTHTTRHEEYIDCWLGL